MYKYQLRNFTYIPQLNVLARYDNLAIIMHKGDKNEATKET